MTPPRSRQRRSELSDTGRELLAILEEEVKKLHAAVSTPALVAPGAGESSEGLRTMASEIADTKITGHKLHCLMPGGVLHAVADKLEQRMENVEATQKKHEDFIGQYLGEQKLKRFVMPIVVGFIGSSAGAALMVLLFKALIHSAIAGVVKP